MQAWHLHIRYSPANSFSSLPDGRSSDGQHCYPWWWWWRSFHICILFIYVLPVKNTSEESATTSNTYHTVSICHCKEGRSCPASGEWKTVCGGTFVMNIYLLVITYFMQKMSILCIIYLCIMYITFWVVSSCYPIEITLYFSSFLVALRIQPNATPSSHGPVCGTLLQTLARSSGGRDLPAEQIL